MKPAEPQATDIGAVNPVAETSPAEQPAAHPETDVRLLDLNKIVNSTYNPRKMCIRDSPSGRIAPQKFALSVPSLIIPPRSRLLTFIAVSYTHLIFI